MSFWNFRSLRLSCFHGVAKSGKGSPRCHSAGWLARTGSGARSRAGELAKTKPSNVWCNLFTIHEYKSKCEGKNFSSTHICIILSPTKLELNPNPTPKLKLKLWNWNAWIIPKKVQAAKVASSIFIFLVFLKTYPKFIRPTNAQATVAAAAA